MSPRSNIDPFPSWSTGHTCKRSPINSSNDTNPGLRCHIMICIHDFTRCQRRSLDLYTPRSLGIQTHRGAYRHQPGSSELTAQGDPSYRSHNHNPRSDISSSPSSSIPAAPWPHTTESRHLPCELQHSQRNINVARERSQSWRQRRHCQQPRTFETRVQVEIPYPKN